MEIKKPIRIILWVHAIVTLSSQEALLGNLKKIIVAAVGLEPTNL